MRLGAFARNAFTQRRKGAKQTPASQPAILRLQVLAATILLAFGCLLNYSRSDAQTRQTRRPSRIAPADVIYSFQFSPDGRTLAIARGANGPGRVELWDVETGTLRHSIKGFDGAVWSVSFAPDGKSLVTGGIGYHTNKIQEKLARWDRRPFAELKWWDAQTGELKHQVEMPGEDRLGIKAYYSPDGKLLAAVEYKSVVMTFAFTGFDGMDGSGRFGGFPVLHSTGLNADLKLLDADTGEVKQKLRSGLSYDGWPSVFWMNQRREPLAFTPNGELIAGWTSNELRVWNSLSGTEVRKLKNFKGRLSAAAFSPDSRLLAIGTTQSWIKKHEPIFKTTVQIYETATGNLTQTIPLVTQSISNLVFARNGRQLLVAGSQNQEDHTFSTLELVDLGSGSLGRIQAHDEGAMSSAVLSPNGALVAFQVDASTVKLVDPATWRSRYTFDASSDRNSDNASLRRFLVTVKSVMTLAFSADGKVVSGEIEQGGIKSWDTRTGELKKQFAEHDETGSIADISANPSMVVEAGSDEALRLWNVASGEKKILSGIGEEVSAVALSPDGATLAVGSANRITLIATQTQKTIQTLPTPRVNCLSFSADGRSLASAAENGSIEVWDVASGQRKQTISSGAGKITALRFSPNGRVLASANRTRQSLFGTRGVAL